MPDNPPTDRQLADFERAARQRDAEAVAIAMFIADGEWPPGYLVERFHQANAAFHIAREEAGL